MTPGPAKPRLSIVLPTYNVEPYIDRCLRSCVEQTADDFEIIVVDDCGTDQSIEIARRWATKDKRIRIVHNPRNLGTYHARRVGVESATAEYIFFVDPDDTIQPDAVETLLRAGMQHRPDIVFYGTKIFTRRIFATRRFALPRKNAATSSAVIDSIVECQRLNFSNWGKAYSKRCALAAISLLGIAEEARLTFAEDYLFFIACALTAERSCTVPGALYHYHENHESVTQANSQTARIAKSRQIDLIVERLEDVRNQISFAPDPRKIKLIERACKHLRADQAFITRHLECGSPARHYAASLISSLGHELRSRNLIRLAIFSLSLSRIRL